MRIRLAAVLAVLLAASASAQTVPFGSGVPGKPLVVAMPDVRVAGATLSATAGSSFTIPVAFGQGTVGLSFAGLTASGAVLSFSSSNDGGATFTSKSTTNCGTGVASPTYAADGSPRIDAAGATMLKVTVTTGGSGSITYAYNVSTAPLACPNSPVTIGGQVSPLLTTPSNPAAVLGRQVKIVTTGTAVQLPALALVNGIVIKASVYNAVQSKTYTAAVGVSTVTTAYDGSATAGYPLAPGEAASFAVTNASAIWVNGTAGDVFSYEGN